VVQVHYDEGVAIRIGPEPMRRRSRGRWRSVGGEDFKNVNKPVVDRVIPVLSNCH